MCRVAAIIMMLSCTVLSAAAQYENIWAFGRQAGLDFSGPAPVPFSTSMVTSEGCASVCNKAGQLQFYTEGSFVWDRNGNLMPNGSNLTGLSTAVPPLSVTSSSMQGTLIVPHPQDGMLYFVFSVSQQELSSSNQAGWLYYSMVDMRLNGGLGDVVAAEKGVFIDSLRTEFISAIAGDRCNVWLITCSTLEQEFKTYEITASGLNRTPVVSTFSGGYGPYGFISGSGDGKKLAVGMNGAAGFKVYDFDGTRGTLSNPLSLTSNAQGIGAAFSPDNSKLYLVASDGMLRQYDLSSGDPGIIVTTEVLLANVGFTTLKLGPDRKIYFHSPVSNSMGAIQHPDSAGLTCGYAPSVVALAPGTRFTGRMPNVVAVIPRDTLLSSESLKALCFSSRVPLRARNDSAGWGYSWNNGSTGNSAVADTPGRYWVQYFTAPCNFHVDTFEVTFPHGVLPSIVSRAACRTDSNGRAFAGTYPGDPVGYSYTWIQGPDTLSITDTLRNVPSGSYRLHVRTHTGCDTVLFFDIESVDFRVSFAMSDSLICAGDTLQLENTSDTHFNSYHWTFAADDTSTQEHPLPFVYTESGSYVIRLTGSGEICADTTYRDIVVDDALTAEFIAEPDAACVGQPVYFYPKTDSTTVRLIWDFDTERHAVRDFSDRYTHGFDMDGIRQVSLTVQSRACPDVDVTDSIRVYAFPKVDLGADTSLCLHGQPIYLRNLHEASLDPYHQVWSTGDTTSELKVVHPGIYTLSVTTEPIGCTTTESVVVSKDCYIDIPNAFSPNGDGHNDYFLPRQLLTEGLIRFHMQVYNRWGQVLFETDRTDGRGWDGRSNAIEQPMGVYIYRIEADFKNGARERYDGNVTLIR